MQIAMSIVEANMKQTGRFFILSVVMAVLPTLATSAQDIRVPFYASVDLGFIPGYADSVSVQNFNVDTDASSDSTGTGNTRVGANALINMGPRRRFGAGLAYRRYAPGGNYFINGVGPALSWTRVYSPRFLAQFQLAGGPAWLRVDEEEFEEVYESATGESITWGSSRGVFLELDLRFAFPVFTVTELSDTRSLMLAPYLSVAGGVSLANRYLETPTLQPVDGEQWDFVATTATSSVSLGVKLLVVDALE